MKKLMSAMLGLTMLAGTSALFAADKDAKDTTKPPAKTASKSHKKGKTNKKMTTAPTSAPVQK